MALASSWKAIAVLGVISVLAITAGGYATYTEFASQDDLDIDPAGPQMEMAEYDETNETMTLVISNGTYTRQSMDSVYIHTERRANVTITTPHRNATTTNTWAPKSEGGIASFPLEPSSQVIVLEDGVDSDGDGIEGIEPGDVVWVFEDQRGEPATERFRFVISDGEVES